jgi:hypothetical protein
LSSSRPDARAWAQGADVGPLDDGALTLRERRRKVPRWRHHPPPGYHGRPPLGCHLDALSEQKEEGRGKRKARGGKAHAMAGPPRMTATAVCGAGEQNGNGDRVSRKATRAGIFVRAIRANNRPMEMDGRGQLGHFRPRWVQQFPAQAQVAAWARGCEAKEHYYCFWPGAKSLGPG